MLWVFARNAAYVLLHFLQITHHEVLDFFMEF